MLSLYYRNQNTLFCFNCFAKDLFTLTSNEFKMVCKVEGNPQLDSRYWSMHSNILDKQNLVIRIREVRYVIDKLRVAGVLKNKQRTQATKSLSSLFYCSFVSHKDSFPCDTQKR